MARDRSWRLRAALITAGFVAAACLVYWPALVSFFHSDDFVLLSAVRENGPLGVWSGRESAFFRPLISLSLFIDVRLWELNAAGYHAENVAVHTLNALLVVSLFPALLRAFPASAGDFSQAERQSGAVFAGLFFLLQPTHPEAVTWVSGRTDVYATCFCLLALRAHLCYAEGGGWAWQKAAWLFYGLSLLCKESALLLPLILLALDLWRARTERWRIIPPFFAAVTLYLLLRVVVIGKLIGGYGAVHTSFHPVSLLQSALWFFCSGFLPLLPRWIYCLAALGAGGLVFVVRLRQKQKPPAVMGFLLLAFFLAAAPALNLGGGPAPDGMSGRLVYLASAFAALALPLLWRFLLPRRYVCCAVLVLLLGIFGTELYALNTRWQEAGQIAQSCITDMGAVADRGWIVLVDVPDTLYPAFVLRNGAPEALRLFYPSAAPTTEIVSSLYLYDPGDAVAVSYALGKGGTGRKTVFLTARTPPDRFIQPSFTLFSRQGTGWRASETSPTRLQAVIDTPVSPDTVFLVFSKGHLSPLDLMPQKTEP